ncbi:thiamine phosphate synthase [Tuberibacillus sp. Marseille-P3662]|uniref:thiamine phosphate synthase n=1 Tax=Tuberibacillus sp. Marseille-P3662 TaxID=1965358 RepID=UPI0015945AB6|nr:thiamine phosphate synthase [Tuberibacillus sp. Marseille-P3662]
MPAFHVISNGQQSLSQFLKVLTSIEPWIDAVHIREKQRTALEIRQWVEAMLENKCPTDKIILNTGATMNHLSDIGGIHLPEDDSPKKWKASYPHLHVGCSSHSSDSAAQKAEAGADYLLFGHVFSTASKRGLMPQGIETLKQVCQAVDIPVLAIGGIQADNVAKVMDAGAHGVAVMNGIMQSEEPEREAEAIRMQLEVQGHYG